jgi:hypothetical protein
MGSYSIVKRAFLKLAMPAAVLFILGANSTLAAQKYSSGGTSGGTTTTTAKKETSGNLTLIGMLGAQSVYNMYLVIGAISDNFVAGTYEASTASELLGIQVAFAERAMVKFEELVDKGELTAEDEEFIGDMIVIYKGLQKQATYGKEFVEGDGVAANKFATQRKDNWAKITKLLDLD